MRATKIKFRLDYPAYSANATTRYFELTKNARAAAKAYGVPTKEFARAVKLLHAYSGRYTVGRTVPAKGGLLQIRFVLGHGGYA